MPEKIKIVFTAELGCNQFADCTISLGGPYPDIDIVNLNTNDGKQTLSIERVVPNYSDATISAIVAECSIQIEYFISVLGHVRGCRVRLLDDVQYIARGNPHKVNLSGSSSLTARLVGMASPEWFKTNKEAFHKKYNYDLMKRFNFANGLDDPVSKFVSLYSLLLSIYADSQKTVDNELLKIDKNICFTHSPHKKDVLESIFTRLRNELAHNRTGVSIIRTHEEIRMHVNTFSYLVSEIVKPKIELAQQLDTTEPASLAR